MLGFTPLASAPLADSGVKNVAVIASDITAGVPVLDTATVAVISNFAPQDITAGVPVVDTAPVFEDESFTPQHLFGGDPVLDTLSVGVISNFAPQDIFAGTPVVDTLPFSQDYQLAFNDIFAGQPTLSARLTWDFQEPIVDLWLLDERFPRKEAGSSTFAIFNAMIDAALLRDDDHVALFLTAEAIEGRPLGDITGNGQVRTFDAGQMQSYANGSLTNTEYKAYIEDYMLPYMAARQSDYQAYYDADFDAAYTSVAALSDTWTEQADSSASWTDVPESVNVWTNAA